MSTFETRWKTCAARAAGAASRNETAPFGFTTRVLAAVARGNRSEATPLEAVWQRLTLRSLRWIGAVLLICFAFELTHLRQRRPLETGIENTVAQLVWNL
jgi:hypothetical protein